MASTRGTSVLNCLLLGKSVLHRLNPFSFDKFPDSSEILYCNIPNLLMKASFPL